MKRSTAHSGPLLPGEASTIITVVAGLFGLGGAITVLGLVVVLLTSGFGAKSFVLDLPTVFRFLVVGGFGLAYCVTGIWLYQARRRGAYLAMGALTLNLLSLLLGTARPSVWDILLPVAALAGVVLAWPHLSASGREVDEHVRITSRGN
jgi:hypothetical protein